MIQPGTVRQVGGVARLWPVDPVLKDNPDRLRWNARYAAGFRPSFEPHPLARLALSSDLPQGPVLDLAAGTSGSVILAAKSGRTAVGVDVSDEALSLLAAEIERQGMSGRVTVVQADLRDWRPGSREYALVLCTGYWDRDLFVLAADAVLPGGVLGWEALTTEALDLAPQMPSQWCVRPGEPASLLPAGWEVISSQDVPGRSRRRMLARRPLA